MYDYQFGLVDTLATAYKTMSRVREGEDGKGVRLVSKAGMESFTTALGCSLFLLYWSYSMSQNMNLIYNVKSIKTAAKNPAGLVPKQRVGEREQKEGSISDLLWLLFCQLLNVRRANPLS